MRKPLVHCRRRRLPIPQLFANALEDQHIRVHAHTHRENHTRNSRQRQGRTAEAQEPEKNNQVQNQRHVRVNPRSVVIDQHENQHGEHADDRRLHARPNRVRPQRRPHRPLFQILDPRRQRARIQNQRQVLRLLIREPSLDHARVADLALDDGNFHHLVIQHHSQVIPHVLGGEIRKAPSTLGRQEEIHFRQVGIGAAPHPRLA